MKIAAKQFGFTLVELVVVIVVIAILAALVSVSYNSAQTKTKATTEMNDIKSLNRALQSYYSDNSVYPTTGMNWYGYSQWQDFIPGLTPKYIAKLPQQKDTTIGSDTTYLYISDGANYKLISHRPTGSHSVCLTAIGIAPSMADPSRTNNPVPNCWAFGMWTDGASTW